MSDEPKKTPEQRLADVKRKIRWIRYAAVAALLLVLGLYLIRFHSGLSDEVSDFGQAGDFVGGFLNPLFAMGALFALLYTIVLQVEEMQDMRTEFTKTVDAAKHQTFEATFFQMLRLHNDNIERITFEYTVARGVTGGIPQRAKRSNHGREAMRNYYEKLRESIDETVVFEDLDGKPEDRAKRSKALFQEFYTEHGLALGTYFITVHEIMSLVDSYEDASDSTKYARLFATQLTTPELMLIAYYCASTQRLSRALTRQVDMHSMLDMLDEHSYMRIIDLKHFDDSAFNLI